MTNSPEAPLGDPPLPRPFGRYVLVDRIGRGGMADIFLALDRTQVGALRRVVVKRILPELSGQPQFAAMLVAEAKLAALLRHANIVQVYDLGRVDEHLFIAMEYVEGFDLHQLLRRLSAGRIPLPVEHAVLVAREVLRALDYAHRARDVEGRPLGLVHRDVSPSNVLVSFEGEVKLCDFGIARALGATTSDESAIARSRVAGKAAYMSPEQARGEPVDGRSDLFAAAILLWELLAGRRMYRGTDEQLLSLARAAEVPPLPARGLPDEQRLHGVLARALARDPEARFASARQMLDALEEWALGARLLVSPLRLGAFLTEHFADELVQVRRARERAAAAAWESAGSRADAPPLPAEPETSEIRSVPEVRASGPRDAAAARDPTSVLADRPASPSDAERTSQRPSDQPAGEIGVGLRVAFWAFVVGGVLLVVAAVLALLR